MIIKQAKQRNCDAKTADNSMKKNTYTKKIPSIAPKSKAIKKAVEVPPPRKKDEKISYPVKELSKKSK